jgi:hypothetical protein
MAVTTPDSDIVKLRAAAPGEVPSGDEMHHLTIELTATQAKELEKLTGQAVTQLRITVEELSDIAGVIVN